MNKSVIIFIILIGFLLNGCFTPAPIITISPAESEILWERGVGLIEKSDHDISVLAGFFESHNDLVCFDVTIQNSSEQNITVDPKFFECLDQTNVNLDRYERPPISQHMYALNPEIQIQGIDAELLKENARYQSSAAIEGVGAMLGLIADVSAFFKPLTQEQKDERNHQREEDKNRWNEQESQHYQTVESLNQKKTFWQTETLRKTTLQPNQTVRGKVFYQRLTQAKLLKLRFPCDQACVEMYFKQNKVKL